MGDIQKVGELGITDSNFYDIVNTLIKSKALVFIDNQVVYMDEIRPDYKNKKMYFPIFKNDEIVDGETKLEYNNRVELVEIHSYKDGFLRDKLWLIPNLSVPKAYSINLKNLQLNRELKDEDFKAKDLFYRYIKYSYGNKEELDILDYIEVKKKYYSRKKLKLLKELGLDFYGEYEEMDYRDVRNWKLVELEGRFIDEELGLGEAFNCRRLQFELELYTRIYKGLLWEKWTLGNIDNLINNKFDYIKYKEKGIYLIFKERWLNGIG